MSSDLDPGPVKRQSFDAEFTCNLGFLSNVPLSQYLPDPSTCVSTL